MSNSLKPAIRFKEFTNDWEQRRVGELFNIGRGYVLSKKEMKPFKFGDFIYPVYSSQTENNGLLGYNNKYSDKDAITWTTDGYAGTVFYRKGYFYATNVCGILSEKLHKPNLFFASALQKETHKHIDNPNFPKLMSHKMANIPIKFPEYEEQNLVSNLLDNIDSLITLHQRKLEKLKNIKNMLLEKMFADEKTFKPAIRFKEFTNAWEQRKFKDIYIKAMSGGTPNTGKIDYYNGNIPFLSIADMTKQQKYIENTTKQISNLGLKNSSCWLVPPNSLLLSIYASLGKTAINKANMATSQAILGIILKDVNETQFYYYLLTKMENKKYWYKYISLGTQPNLSLSTVEEALIFSTEFEEKIKIGNTFESLDSLITLHQRKLEKLKNIKNMLLEKMFVNA